MEINRRPETVPIRDDEETTITFKGTEVSLIYDALTLLQKTSVKKAYNCTLSEHFDNRLLDFNSALAEIQNAHTILLELDELFEIPF